MMARANGVGSSKLSHEVKPPQLVSIAERPTLPLAAPRAQSRRRENIQR